ncbi:unnamed protein product [Pseudo-nitzschia multistriata]|uniref:1-alkyl-2-acetylglycerophosphocholine esterase n=1 Tax=Pseudo-nitzschia multistriata TaxID=183589 RepID=A0A448ZQE5_9STRA|nr:unnamed protein product [Pseudo-nitzschia multistriata]
MRSLSVFLALRAASSSSIGGTSSALALRSSPALASRGGFSFRPLKLGRSLSSLSSNGSDGDGDATMAPSNTISNTNTGMPREEIGRRLTGLPMGPYPVGVTTVQIDGDPKRGRGLQTEVWYPASEASRASPVTKYSDYLGLDKARDPVAARAAANARTAIGGYRDGISVEELDDPSETTWLTTAVRNAGVAEKDPNHGDDPGTGWPLVVFSHGSGAYRASYGFWTEFLASHGYVVAACDHPGSARYTIVDGEVITPGGARSKRERMEKDRPLDVLQVLDGIASNPSGLPLFGAVDTNNVAITGMSFGGYTTAATLELGDPRITAAVMMCSSMAMSGTMDYHTPSRKNKSTPVMVMIGTEDTVLGPDCNDANRRYVDHHEDGDAYLLELVRGGHVSFTSCELYDPEYGNGINARGRSKSMTKPGETYLPWGISDQHAAINHYGLCFLNKYVKKKKGAGGANAVMERDAFDASEVLLTANRDGLVR